MDDGDDLERAKRGDAAALARVIARHEDRLRRLAEARLTPELRARTRVSDVLQSTYLRVLRSIADFEGHDEEQFAGWMVRILENTVRDRRKFFQRDKRRVELPLSDALLAQHALAKIAGASGPLRQGEEFVALRSALDSLKEEYRHVLLLRMADGLSHRDTAIALGRTEGAARVLYARARAAFGVALERARRDGSDRA